MKYQKFAPVVLRFGLGIVFLLFGLQKLTNPGQTTAEIQLLLNFELADAAALSYYLGIAEMIIAIGLFIGFKVRFFTLLGSLLTILFFISFIAKYGLSINPDLYRDIGLFSAAIALFLLGAGPLSIDNRRGKVQ